MPHIQVITLRGQPAALVAGDRTILADHIPDTLIAHVKAKALYALHIRDGELPGPYTDAGAERYAAAATTAAPAAPELRHPALARRHLIPGPARKDRGGHRRA